MSIFDEFYFSVFTHVKTKIKKKANFIALLYISLLQISLILLLGIFFGAFFKQMNLDTFSEEKAWTLFILASFVICVKNWIQYTGRKRSIMNAKLSRSKSKYYNIWLLWLLPVSFITLSIVLWQVL